MSVSPDSFIAVKRQVAESEAATNKPKGQVKGNGKVVRPKAA